MEPKKVALLAVLCSLACAATPPRAAADHDAALTFWSADSGSLAERLTAGMSDEELLGQVYMLGYRGTLPDRDILDWVRRHGLGGVKIFGWNARTIDELTQSISELQGAAQSTRTRIPLFVATDQEGGWVRHVDAQTSTSAGNLALGASGLPVDAYKTGFYIGRELHVLGINMDLAPTVDVYTNPRADVIGTRSFGADASDDGLLAIAFYKGLAQSRIIATAKHYPGHGDTAADSHGTLPVVPTDFNVLWYRDLLPYRMLIHEGLPAIMAGHLAYPNVSGDLTPASLSPYFESELLRRRMGFGGVIVTDDLLMAGADAAGKNLRQICVAALRSGDDLLMISQTPALDDPCWTALLALMRKDDAFRSEVVSAAQRSIRLKLTYMKGADAVPLAPDSAEARHELPDRAANEFFFEQACRAVTVIKEGGLPIDRAAQEGRTRVLLAGQIDEFFLQGMARFPRADQARFSFDPFYHASPKDVEALRNKATRYDLVIFCVANPNSEQVLEALAGIKAEVVVVSTLSPVYLRAAPWVAAAVAVYGTNADCLAAGFAAITGDFTPTGRLPVAFLNGVFP